MDFSSDLDKLALVPLIFYPSKLHTNKINKKTQKQL